MSQRTQTRHSDREPRGFTLIELVSVLVLVSILSVTAIPAISRLNDARNAALLNECDRMIRFAQSHANSTGTPTGTVFDLDQQTVSLLSLGGSSVAVSPIHRAGTGQAITLAVAAAFPGAALDAAGEDSAPQASGAVALWFDYDGSPQLRDADGQLRADLEDEFIVRVTSGPELRVLPTTGAIQR